jgi:hypothetical protein
MRGPQNIFLILIVIACIFLAGCVQSPGNHSVSPAVLRTSVPAPETAAPVPTASVTPAAQPIVTIIRYISPLKDIRDSELLFTLQVPAEWNVSTWQLTKSDMADFRTDLVADKVFSISSYPSARSREQEYREQFRQWSPAPAESSVTINGIRYDRFESSAEGNTMVAYLAGTNSANERGYAAVLVFVARDGNRFEKEDYERVVSSFRYFSTRWAGSVSGEEIPHYYAWGNAMSGKPASASSAGIDSSDWDTGEGTSGDLGSSGGSSSGAGSSPGGGHCGRG